MLNCIEIYLMTNMELYIHIMGMVNGFILGLVFMSNWKK